MQENQSAMEREDSQSALLYLYEEVSKLVSPTSTGFLDTNSPSPSVNDASECGSFLDKWEDGVPRSFLACDSSCLHMLPHMAPCDQMTNVNDGSHSNKVTPLIEPHSERTSSWKVLSLINLQCERLLHQTDGEDSDPSLTSPATQLMQSTVKSSAARAAGPDTPLICGTQEIRGCVGTVQNGNMDCSEAVCAHQLQCCAKDSKVGSEIPAVKLESVGKSTTAYLQSVHRDKKDVKLMVDQEWEGSHSCKKDLNVPRPPMMTVSAKNEAENHLLRCNLVENTSVSRSKAAVLLDVNANLILTVEPPGDVQQPPLRSVQPPSRAELHLFSTTEEYKPFVKQVCAVTLSKPECSCSPMQEKSPPGSQLKSRTSTVETGLVASETSKQEPTRVQMEGNSRPSTIQCASKSTWRNKTPRKQPHPSRSVDIQDPDFQGVTFRIDTELDDDREQCRLLITSKYSKELCKSVRRVRARTRASQKTLKSSSSDEESDQTIKGKVCASCCTRKTPMWRDAEDGTPLCNACGIRYKKYKVRCVNCWHIPRKEGNSSSHCLKCGNCVRLPTVQQKRTT